MGRAGNILLGVAALAVFGAALGSLAQGFIARPGEPPASESPATGGAGVAAAIWAELPAAPARFALRDNLFGPKPDFYAARRNVAGGGRLDQLAFGDPAGGRPYLRLTFYRPFDEPLTNASFWLEMARRAGEVGLALGRSPSVPQLVSTQLGQFEIGALEALGPAGPRPCLGFRRQSEQPAFVISGFACLGDGAADLAFAREALVCALEAIQLAGPEQDPELRAFFERDTARECGAPRAAW